MQVGEKIRALRTAKLMTQSELAGNCITRNMLCQIERGTALPSIQTAMYLAARLGVPLGYLFAEDAEDLAYRKLTELPNIRRAFATGDFAGALSLLSAAFGDRQDDELSLIRAECSFGVARQIFEAGHLRRAAAAFDQAIISAAETCYETGWIKSFSAVYFRALGEISPTLQSDILDAETVSRAAATGDAFCEYFAAAKSLEKHDLDVVSDYLAQSKTLYAEHIGARLLMYREEYGEALSRCEALLSREDLGIGVLMYHVFCDMDICCRQNDDYKRAFEYAASAQSVLERLLSEEGT